MAAKINLAAKPSGKIATKPAEKNQSRKREASIRVAYAE